MQVIGKINYSLLGEWIIAVNNELLLDFTDQYFFQVV